MILNSQQIPDIIDSRPLEVMFHFYDQNPKSYTAIFETRNITKAFVDNIRFSGLGRFVTKEEGGAVTYDIPVQGERFRTTVGTFALGTQFTMEAMMDAQFPVLDQQVNSLAMSQLDHEERLAWSAIADAFAGATTGLGIDGVSVVNTAHPLLKPPTPSITTTSNQLSPGAPLGTETLEAMLIIFTNQISDEGHHIGKSLKPRWLVIPTSLMHVADTILGTEKRPGGNLNDKNTLTKFGIESVASPYLNDIDTDDFHLMASAPQNGWRFYSRLEPELTRSIDPETGNRKMREWYRANVGNVRHLGHVGCQP